MRRTYSSAHYADADRPQGSSAAQPTSAQRLLWKLEEHKQSEGDKPFSPLPGDVAIILVQLGELIEFVKLFPPFLDVAMKAIISSNDPEFLENALAAVEPIKEQMTVVTGAMVK